MTPRPPVVWVFTLMCLIWGSTFMVLKMGLSGTPPLLGVSLRHLAASLILLAIIRYRGLPIPWSRQAVKLYATVGVLNFGLSYALTYSGTIYIYSNISALLWASFPITTALTAHFFLPAERLSWLKATGILIGFGGVALIFAGYGFGQSPNLWLGMSLVMLAVLAGTWPNIYLKMASEKPHPLALNAVATGIGGSLTLVLSLLFERDQSMAWTPANLGLLLYLALFGTVIAWVAFFYLLEHMEVVKLSFVGFIAPLIAMFMGMLVLDEYLPPVVYLGAGLVLLGIFTSDARRYLTVLKVRP